MILNEKNDFTFWIRYGISTNFGMIVLDYPKSEVTYCVVIVFGMVWTAQKLQYGSPKMPVLGRALAKPINWLFSIISWLQ